MPVLAVAVAVMLLAVPVASMAQSAPSMLSAANWVLAPIESSDTKDRHFCSVKGNFGTTVSLVFARDSAGGQSLALEFPDKSFAAGATLPTVLSVGSAQYQINALAATTRVALIGVGRGGAIEAGMLQDQMLDVQITGQGRHVLALEGFGAAASKLDDCLAARGKGEDFAAQKFAADVATSRVQTVNPVIKREVTRMRNVSDHEVSSFDPAIAAHTAVLEDEIRRLREENRKLLAEKQAAESQLLALTVDTAAGEGAVPAAPTAPVIEPRIVRSDKDILWPPSKNFSDMVSTYMTTEAARCTGDFAQTPGAQHTLDGQPVQEVETACMGIAASAGSAGLPSDYAGALLFVGRSGKIEVIAHQGPAGMIEQALQARAAALRDLGIQ